MFINLPIIICLTLVLLSSKSEAGNYATCLLDRLPDVQNDVGIVAVWRVCQQKYPGGYDAVIQGEGRGFWSYKSGFECGTEKAAKTLNMNVTKLIFFACKCLYDEPLSSDTGKSCGQLLPLTFTK